jgi:ribosomal subunit interface protein
MQVQISGKKIDLGESLQAHCHKAIEHVAAKFDVRPTHCTVWFSKGEHHQFEVDFSLHLSRGVYIRSHAHAEQAAACFDLALSRAHEKIARHKKRLDDHHKHKDNHGYQKIAAIEGLLQADWSAGKMEEEPVLIEESTRDLQVLSVGDAAMQLELADVPVIVFRNKAHGRTNLLYRKPGGHIGWMDLQH